ncbi:hypothetical protein R1sor_012995 [Riccia sorocarpa]|uniref:Uncharacterized protein n=1 Tax=Riccia sorocarpa TaxID=122646 RepID=A0ABD3H789_9MARC
MFCSACSFYVSWISRRIWTQPQLYTSNASQPVITSVNLPQVNLPHPQFSATPFQRHVPGPVDAHLTVPITAPMSSSAAAALLRQLCDVPLLDTPNSSSPNASDDAASPTNITGGRPNCDPECILEAFDPLPSEKDQRDEQTPDEQEGDARQKSVHSETTSTPIQELKGEKKSSAAGHTVIADCMTAMSDRMATVEQEKLQFLRETESQRMEVARDQVQSMKDHPQNFRGALGLMAQSLVAIATSLKR